ncbi:MULTISPECIES: glycosyltransferase family 39 protein [Yersinia]|uniref:glycosyltransferase family 39 protein n=1 Tax=Yersinia TaxID=629 RepID=UPI000EB2388F|nr:glycosyltransferase family 39 protein [Yersinia sp. IP36721]
MTYGSDDNYKTGAILFILIYSVIWIAISSNLDPAVPYDAVESLNWANSLEFGSPKNPYIVGAVTAIGLLINPLINLALYWYVSHFTVIAVGLWGIFLLSRRLFGSYKIAFFSMLALNLSGVINFDIISYNDNYLLVMFWPYLFLFFVKSIYDNKAYWYALAVVCGLAAMSKYSSFAFFPFMLIYAFSTKKGRESCNSKEFYLSLLLFLLIIAPNIFWLYQHDFAAFNWVDSQINAGLNSKVLFSALVVFYPIIIIILLLKMLNATLVQPDSDEKKAVLFVFTPPLILIFGYFLFNSGGRITEWLQPFTVLSPVIALCFLNVERVKSWRGINLSLLIVAAAVCLGYATVLYKDIRGAGSKFNYIQPLSAEINQIWRDKYQVPLRYVGGGYFSQWLTFYAPDRPLMAEKWSNNEKPNLYTPNISEKEISQAGGLFLSSLNSSCQDADFQHVLRSFPGLPISEMNDYVFVTRQGKEMKWCLAFVSPAEQSSQ